jgi:Spy/CpxP family protein refolding chaperone
MMQHGHGDHDMGGHAMLGGSEHDDDKAAAMIEHLMEKLGVSEPVHKKIDDLLYEAKKRAIALRADAERAHLELEHSLSQDAPDTDAVLKQMDKVGQARTELMKVWMKVRLEGAKLLTPDQRAQLKHLMHDGPHGEGPEHGHDHEHDH